MSLTSDPDLPNNRSSNPPLVGESYDEAQEMTNTKDTATTGDLMKARSIPIILETSQTPEEMLNGLGAHEESGKFVGTWGDEAQASPKRKLPRSKSIKILLEKTELPGQYMLNTDDPELRALLKEGLVRSEDGKIQMKKSRFSDIVLKKQFTAFDRLNTNDLPSFHGFFSLFWIGVSLLIVRVAANNWRAFGSVLGKNEILRLMASRDLFLLGFMDCVMMSLGVVSVALQKTVVKGYLSWGRSGWILQNLWQAIFLGAFMWFIKFRSWPWTHAVFLTLHTITMLMKQHSYAFYNGYLSDLYKRRKVLDDKLQQLDDAAIPSPSSPLPTAHTTSYFDAADLSQFSRRRKPPNSIGLPDVDQDVIAVAAAIESDAPLSQAHLRSLRALVVWETQALTEELKGTCSVTQNHYPRNLTVHDWFLYVPLPTLVYELEYPRQEKINWYYVAEKTAATFGIILVMIIVSTAYIYPVVTSILEMKEHGIETRERLQEFPWAFLDLLFPMMMEYLLSWYVIWECILNLLAEVTRFADRGFYADWWNSHTWDAFARDWNRPVHHFLLRFAYHSSITTWKISRPSATLLTFLLSACVHELVMAMIFDKIRGYLLCMQLLQLPLIFLSRTRFLAGRHVLGNVQFWIGIFFCPSFLCSLYLFL